MRLGHLQLVQIEHGVLGLVIIVPGESKQAVYGHVNVNVYVCVLVYVMSMCVYAYTCIRVYVVNLTYTYGNMHVAWVYNTYTHTYALPIRNNGLGFILNEQKSTQSMEQLLVLLCLLYNNIHTAWRRYVRI